MIDFGSFQNSRFWWLFHDFGDLPKGPPFGTPRAIFGNCCNCARRAAMSAKIIVEAPGCRFMMFWVVWDRFGAIPKFSILATSWWFWGFVFHIFFAFWNKSEIAMFTPPFTSVYERLQALASVSEVRKCHIYNSLTLVCTLSLTQRSLAPPLTHTS